MDSLTFAFNGLPNTLNAIQYSRTKRITPQAISRRRAGETKTATSSHKNHVPLLELKDISYRVPRNYDLELFRDMNFKVFPNEFILLIGPNGSGKSTVINIMTGLTTAKRKEGTILWQGNVIKPKKLLDYIGVVLQNPGDFFFLPTVLDELVLGRQKKTPDDVRRVMTAVGLQSISLLSNPRSLSGGQIRRLSIASQFIRDPRPTLFVLDEPLSGVDWAGRRDLARFLGSFKSKFAVVIVTHEPGELLQYADRVMEVVDKGIHEIDPTIIVRARKVRRERLVAAKEKAIQEALKYNAQLN